MSSKVAGAQKAFARLGTGVFLLASGCSWGRFDDVTADPPVVLLTRPKEVAQGFGHALSTKGSAGSAFLLVSGAPGVSTGAAFDVRSGEGPHTEAIASDLCASAPPSDRCFLGSVLAALGEVEAPDGTRIGFCFAVGAGKLGEAPEDRGIIVDCVGNQRLGFVLPVPAAFDAELLTWLSGDEAEPLAMGSDGTTAPNLVVGAPNQRLAWLYTAFTEEAVELSPPGSADPSYGTQVVSLPLGDDRLHAVSAPDVGRVFLFKAVGAEAPTYAGCVGGVAGFGRSLSVGNVTPNDTDPELVVADAQNVHVFQARMLLELEGTDTVSCSLSALPEGAHYASFGCSSSKSVSGCETSEFGGALTVADLDGDGDGEVVVGAPRMKIRDKSGAGAIVIYDVEKPGEQEFADLKFMSTAEQDDFLGFSLTRVPVDGRDVIVAGAPGAGKAAVFHCSSVLPPHKASSRCR